ncbi:hypothetical protein AC629_21545 [Bradyrhizobium sp. NAS80.1]|uniref:hypothetical protein n=1 Tax=Bradyrhizobium sp. NAS80.1 TaxID=1680159 RepID=UPI00095A03A2|nr:hypothetical protein [Bradyrhizobium sp. NAS80.1]OKO84439.1 hypothetical protein AC629_21545 [Bradyrhizobium sp. NAS80.1]
MKIAIVLVLGVAVAGCNQTTSSTADRLPMGQQATAGRTSAKQAAVRCAETAQRAADAQTNGVIVGSALSMVGGFGGMGGRGGEVAAQAASMGGSVIQSQANDNAAAALERDCR